MTNEDINLFKNNDIADYYFGERELNSMKDFEEITKKYNLIANAADRTVHKKTKYNEKFDYDIIFIGAKLPKKKFFFENILIPLSKKYNVGIFGPYWTLKDNSLRVITKYLRKFKFDKFNQYLNDLRISIPYERERDYYFSSKICINFHEKENITSHYHKIINQRTFKIAACGGFQICDDIDNIHDYFSNEEIVTAKSIEDWFEKIDYFIENNKERNKIRENSYVKCQENHMYEHRIQQILKMNNLNY